MRLFHVLILFAVCSLVSRAGEPADAKKVQEQLQGKWEVVEFILEGRVIPGDVLRGYTVAIESDKAFLVVNGKRDKEVGWTVKLDLALKPWGIDVIPLSDKGKVFHCVFELDGDQLRLCGENEPERNKPAKFESKEGSKTLLARLKRSKE